MPSTTIETNYVRLLNEPTAVNHAVTKAYADARLADSKTYSDGVKSEIMGGLPAASLDTIKELADFLSGDGSVAGGLAEQISSVSTAVDDERNRAEIEESGLSDRVTIEVARAKAAEVANSNRIAVDKAELDALSWHTYNVVDPDLADLRTTQNTVKSNVTQLQNQKLDKVGGIVTGEIQLLDYLYIGDHWRIAAAASGTRLQFEWSEFARGTAEAVWSVGVPFISSP